MSLGSHTGMSDTGRKRRRNEDSFVVAPPLFAVADGMGGANAGEIASGLAVEALREEKSDEAAGERVVVSLIQEANRRVYQRQSDDAEASGMGTTMTVALVEDGIVHIGHVGDSRAYLYREGELEQLTEDHSLVGELVRSGKITAKEAETHPQRSVITRALGTDPDVDVDTLRIESQAGDVFLLCSDGLYSMVGTEKILDVLDRRRHDLDTAVKELIRAANKRGGDDNITIVAFEITPAEEVTERLPVPPAEGVPPDEEDTLDESQGVPAVTTGVIDADEVQAYAEAHEPKRSGRARRVAVALLLVAILAAVVVALYLLDVV